jgi:hypothetical protein
MRHLFVSREYLPSGSGCRSQGNDKRELCGKALEQFVVRGNELAPLSFGQGNVQTVVDSAAHCRRNGDRPR